MHAASRLNQQYHDARSSRLRAVVHDCKHGNDPEQCAPCLKARGQQPQEPERASINGPRPLPGRPVLLTKVTGGKRAWIDQLKGMSKEQRVAFVAIAMNTDLVMLALAESGQDRFTREDVIVLAYRAFPQRFGLRGFKEYPNSGAVASLVDGKRGLATRGWLVKTKDGYELPRE